MSLFQNAYNTTIYGGNFVSNSGVHDQDGIAIGKLEQHSTTRASHNSKARYDAPKCLARTREAVFREISEWLHIESADKPILWLHGPAGAGKSAIAQSVAEKAQEMGYLLVASFFFNRADGERNSTQRLIPSMACQMISLFPLTRPVITQTIHNNLQLFSRDLKTQLEELIFKPLAAVGVRKPYEKPMLILVDGLDECLRSQERIEFLQAITELCSHPSFPIVVLCTSRSEPDIREAFNARETLPLTASIVLDNQFRPDDDIETFFDHHFIEIKRLHPLGGQIPDIWPSRFTIRELVRKSSGQFIYASTVTKHVASRKHNPMKRLQAILDTGNGTDASPFKELDALYKFILSSVENDDLKIVLRILGLVCVPSLLAMGENLTIEKIEELYNLESGYAILILDGLRSLVHLGESSKSEGLAVLPFHASFSDFLFNKLRSDMFHINMDVFNADHLLLYFKSWPKLGFLGFTRDILDYSKPIATLLTSELLEFFLEISWESYFQSISVTEVLGKKVGEDELETAVLMLDLDKWALLLFIARLYKFCIRACNESPAWKAPFKRAVIAIGMWANNLTQGLSRLSMDDNANSRLWEDLTSHLRQPGCEAGIVYYRSTDPRNRLLSDPDFCELFTMVDLSIAHWGLWGAHIPNCPGYPIHCAVLNVLVHSDSKHMLENDSVDRTDQIAHLEALSVDCPTCQCSIRFLQAAELARETLRTTDCQTTLDAPPSKLPLWKFHRLIIASVSREKE